MQVSLNIKDELYQRAINSGIDMQSKFNEYIANILDKKEYLNSEQFKEDKVYFQKAHKEMSNGEVEMLEHDDVWEKIDNHIQEL